MMKVIFYSLFLVLISYPLHALTNNPTRIYTESAAAWAHAVVQDVRTDELAPLLELLHASYMRSYMTLIVQKEYIDLFTTIGSGWQHITSTRLDPNKSGGCSPQAITPNDKLINQLNIFQENYTVQKEYVEIVEKMVTDESKSFISSKIFIDDLRQRARTVIAEALGAVIQEIQQEFQNAQQALLDAATLFKNDCHIKAQETLDRSLTDILWHYVPNLMITSFVNFDRTFTLSSKACFAAYLESQRVSNLVWHTIELPRASYYAAHYQALFNLMYEQNPASVEHISSPDTLIEQLITYNAQS